MEKDGSLKFGVLVVIVIVFMVASIWGERQHFTYLEASADQQRYSECISEGVRTEEGCDIRYGK